MNKLKLVAGVLVLFVVAVAVASGLLFRAERAEYEQLQALVRLGESKAVLPNDAMPPLWQACKGKLTPGEPWSIVGYVAWMESDQKPRNEDGWLIDQVVVAVQKDFLYDTQEKLRLTSRRPSAPSWRPQAFLDPFTWGSRLTQARRALNDLEKVKYLVVARYDSLELAKVTRTGFVTGGGRYGARVLAVPSGEVLCEGRGVPTMPSEVQAGGSGDTAAEAKADAEERAADLVPFVFTQGVLASPLHMVCNVGGSALCDETGHEAGYHPEVYGR